MDTARLALEELQPSHADRLFSGLQDRRLYDFIDDQPPVDVEPLRQRYTRLAQRKSPDGAEVWLNWALRLRQPSEYIGTVQATILRDGVASIAYVLFSEYWSKGYAREAVAEMIRHLRERYSLTRFTATVDPPNDRSIRLLHAMDFQQFASRQGTATLRGLPADEIDFELVLE